MSLWDPALFCDPATASSRPLVGSSACLLGELVRYDGGHRRHGAVADELSLLLRLERACPEADTGLGVPRPTLKVIATDHGERVVGVADPERDVTAQLRAYADEFADRIGGDWPLCGWVFKARSPSCGVGTAVVETATGERRGDGAFAGQLGYRVDWLLRVEEEHLATAQGLDEFLLQVFLCHDCLWSPAARNPALLLGHYAGITNNPVTATAQAPVDAWRALQDWLADLGEEGRRALITRYRATRENR